jgi:hypothetical protein
MVARIAFGDKVFRIGCKAFITTEKKLELSFKNCLGSVQSHSICLVDIVEATQYPASVPKARSFPLAFVVLNIVFTPENGLHVHRNNYHPLARYERGRPSQRWVTIEFLSPGDQRDFIRSNLNCPEILRAEARHLGKALAEDTLKIKARRLLAELEIIHTRARTEEGTGFLAGLGDQDVLFKLPFKGGEGALRYPSALDPPTPVDEATKLLAGPVAASTRGRTLTLRVKDYVTLNPRTYLNDQVMAFWSEW